MNNVSFASSPPLRSLRGADIATVVTGLALCFIGARFLVAPGAAAEGFGVPFTGVPAYALAKGVRDLSFGVLVIAFTLLGERRAAALTLLIASLIPVVDGAIVLTWRGAHPGYLAMHWGTAALCIALGALQLRRRSGGEPTYDSRSE